PELGEDGGGHGEQPVLTGGAGQLGEPRPEDEASLGVARDDTVVFECHRQAVCRRPGQAGRLNELREGRGARLQCVEYENGLIEYSDPARVVHTPILPSRNPRCKCADGESRIVCPYNETSSHNERHPEAEREEVVGAMGRTLAEKIWEQHVVRRAEGEPDLLYIDLHLVHEV